MQFINISYPQQKLSFPQAVVTGLGKGHGLFFPRQLEPLDNIQDLLEMDFVSRSTAILQHLIGGSMAADVLQDCVKQAFNFPVRLVAVAERIHALELFHGPSLAFKDFGARFMARCLAGFSTGQRTTILTATSGDTGAAVALAFYAQPGIDVVVLYPQGKVTPLQEKLFCTLGGNIHTIAVKDDFDACQRLVKQCFDDQQLVVELGLNSANSINVARLLAQVCYYFEASARLPRGVQPVFCVPSGNFGNVTAGLLAHAIGLPMKRMIAATNRNDTVPRYLRTGKWEPRQTVPTLTNAMDVSLPNNFPRVLELGERHGLPLQELLTSFSITDKETLQAVCMLDATGYLADPHSALAWKALQQSLADEETGVFLCTAHPAKFRETLEAVLNRPLSLPIELQEVADKEVLSTVMPVDFDLLRSFLLKQ
ncbi:MAG: threonine synthase [Gammaproteobacteria bacterium]|nr:MAG: threonine synthase [Gammaproteobacteria bacterium]